MGMSKISNFLKISTRISMLGTGHNSHNAKFRQLQW
jgi:hypothetical protein